MSQARLEADLQKRADDLARDVYTLHGYGAGGGPTTPRQLAAHAFKHAADGLRVAHGAP